MTAQLAFHRCAAHPRTRDLEWTLGAAAAATLGKVASCTFIRSHWHEGDRCLKWAGLRPSIPLVCGRDGCTRPLRLFTITATHNAGATCDDRCTTATGHKCRCACGGRKHGSEA